MRSRLGRLALGIGLALTPRAFADHAFQALLVGTDEVPGPGMDKGGFVAILTVDGTAVTLALTPYDAGGWLSPHLHHGLSGATGKAVLEFPASDGPGGTRTWSGRVSEKVAAEIVASPERYYVDVHTREFPAGATSSTTVRRTSGSPRARLPASPSRSAPRERACSSTE